MRAVKLAARVTSDHTLHLELPKDVGEGPAEVIVLVSDSERTVSAQPEAGSLQDFLSGPRGARFVRSKEEIDAYLRAERDSWE